MASGIARSRSLWRFISVDPEIYPLMGVLSATFCFAGYMLGRKAANHSPENTINLTKDKPFPWHANGGEGVSSGEQNDYKYKYHKFDNPEEIVKAPAADIAHTAIVDLPKDAAQKIEEKFGESKS